jgi:hypothetical protein
VLGSLKLVWLFALAAACMPQSREINDVLAAHKSSDRFVDAPDSVQPREWDAGQWTLYKITTGGRIGYVKHTVTDWTKCGVWLETTVVLGDYDDRTTFKVCFRKTPDPSLSIDEQRDLIEAFMSRRNERTTAVDLDIEKKRKKWLGTVVTLLESFPILAARDRVREGRHEIVVRAGQFAGVHDVPARIWIDGQQHPVAISFHPEVPLGGVLEAVATDEDDDVVLKTELLDYGLEGGKSELPDFDEYAKSVGLD